MPASNDVDEIQDDVVVVPPANKTAVLVHNEEKV